MKLNRNFYYEDTGSGDGNKEVLNTEQIKIALESIREKISEGPDCLEKQIENLYEFANNLSNVWASESSLRVKSNVEDLTGNLNSFKKSLVSIIEKVKTFTQSVEAANSVDSINGSINNLSSSLSNFNK